MPIVSTRIDDRLIHGQVATSWLSHVGAAQIICVNDKAAKNPVQAQVLKMAAPEYIVHVFGVDQFIKIYQKSPIKKTTFLILGSTLDALKLKKAGVDIQKINYGGMRSAPERTITYAHDLWFTQEELEAIDRLFENGVEVEYQVAAYDSPTDLREYIKKVKG